MWQSSGRNQKPSSRSHSCLLAQELVEFGLHFGKRMCLLRHPPFRKRRCGRYIYVQMPVELPTSNYAKNEIAIADLDSRKFLAPFVALKQLGNIGVFRLDLSAYAEFVTRPRPQIWDSNW